MRMLLVPSPPPPREPSPFDPQQVSHLSVPTSRQTRKREKTKPLFSASMDSHSDSSSKTTSWFQRDACMFFLFLVLGSGILFPYNSFITSYDFFTFLHPSVRIEFFLMLSYTIPNFAGLLFVSFHGVRYRLHSRVVPTLAVQLFLMILVPALVFVKMDESPRIATTITACSIMGLCTGILQGSLVGFSGEVNTLMVSAVLAGEALAGTIVSILKMITKASMPYTEQGLIQSSLIYFACAFVVVFACLLLYFYLYRSEYVRRSIALGKSSSVDRGEQAALTTTYMRSDMSEVELNSIHSSSSLEDTPVESTSDGLWKFDLHNSTSVQPTLPSVPSSLLQTSEKVSSWTVFNRIRVPGFFLFLNFLTTLTLFPGVLTEIRLDIMPHDWFAISNIALFNICDLASRFLPNLFRLKTRQAYAIVVVRFFLFIPLFSMMLSETISSPFVFYFTLVLMALSNGYFGVLFMMEVVDSSIQEEKEMTGAMMVRRRNYIFLLTVRGVLHAYVGRCGLMKMNFLIEQNTFLLSGIAAGSLLAIAMDSISH